LCVKQSSIGLLLKTEDATDIRRYQLAQYSYIM
jgi:hypothetical protein